MSKATPVPNSLDRGSPAEYDRQTIWNLLPGCGLVAGEVPLVARRKNGEAFGNRLERSNDH